MQIGRIAGTTRVVGKSQGFIGLPLRDEKVDDTVTGEGTPCMVTAWFPTPDELHAIVMGAAIHVRLYGTQHPPIMLSVGPLPEKDADT